MQNNLVLNVSTNMAGIAKIYALGRALSASIQSSMDMVETVNLFNVAMGDLAVSTNEVVQQMHNLYGLDTTNLQRNIGTFNLLARSMGMSADQSQVLSTNMNQLGIDLASLMNIPIKDVMADLRSGLVGQSETIYKYGMDITEASLVTEALRQGIDKSVRNMSQGEKMALRYSVMIRQSALAHGDFAKTIDTPANQLKILSDRFMTLTRAVGSMFIPALTVVLPYLNALLMILTEVADAIAKFFGYTPPEVKNTVNGFSGIEDGAEDSADAIDKNTKALKEMKNATLGMDELNVIAPPKEPSSKKDKDGGANFLDDFKMPSYDNLMEGIKTTADEIANTLRPYLKDILFLAGEIGVAFLAWKLVAIIPAIQLLYREMKALWALMKLDGILTTLRILAPMFIAMAGAVSILAGAFLLFKGVSKIFEETTPSLEAFLMALGGVALIAGGVALVFGAIPALVTLAVGSIGLLGVYIYKYWDEIVLWTTDKWNGLMVFFGQLWLDVKTGFGQMLDGIKTFFVTKFNQINIFVNDKLPIIVDDVVKWFGELPNKIAYALGFALGSVARWTVDTYEHLKVKIPEITEAVKTWFTELPDKVFTAINTMKDKIELWVKNNIDWFKAEVPRVVDAVVLFFTSIPSKSLNELNFMKGKITEWKESLITWFDVELPKVITNIVNWFKTTPSKVLEALVLLKKDIFNIGKYLLDGIMEGMYDFGRVIKSWARSFMDGFRDAFRIKSPSRLMKDEVGVYLGLGIAEGLESTTSDVVGKANEIASGVQGAFDSVKSDLGMPDSNGYNVNAKVTSVVDSEFANSIYNAVFTAISNVDFSGQVIENVVNLDGDKIYVNQQKVAKNRGMNFDMGGFTR